MFPVLAVLLMRLVSVAPLVYLELVHQTILVMPRMILGILVLMHQTIPVMNRTIDSAVRQNFPADRV
jgi:hypothetical protein